MVCAYVWFGSVVSDFGANPSGLVGRQFPKSVQDLLAVRYHAHTDSVAHSSILDK